MSWAPVCNFYNLCKAHSYVYDQQLDSSASEGCLGVTAAIRGAWATGQVVQKTSLSVFWD